MSEMSEWKPGASREVIRERAEVLRRIRRFFERREVLEVDVPLLSGATGTDLNIECVESTVCGQRAWLQSSPEFFLKRLLAAGCGDVYCLGKAFRDAEVGRHHNPEFTMLEWYRLGWDEYRLMDEVVELVIAVVGQLNVQKASYQHVFFQAVGVDPHTAPLDTLRDMAVDCGSAAWRNESRENCLDLLFSTVVEPRLPQGLALIYDYPECQAALAQRGYSAEGVAIARRFEVFYSGLELANGYLELRDSEEQQRRFKRDLQQRQLVDKPLPNSDQRYLAALQNSLPACAGVALGVDRLIMQMLGCNSLDQVLPFSWPRCK